MIELAHVATGALAGRQCDGPMSALLAGVAVHAAGDFTPHGELGDRSYEASSAIIGILALSMRYGFRSPVVWGAVGSVLPDVEHVLPKRLTPKQPVFPTHRFAWLHSNGPLALPTWLQVLGGGAIVGGLVARRTARATK